MSNNSKISVMVVDDSPTAIQFAAETLRDAGFTVATASDGEEAIEMILADPPDIVVLDIILPKKNGFQVCRELKTHPKTSGVKIVLLSSKKQETDRFWGQRQGADAYITKPVEPADLTAIVGAVAASSHALDMKLEPRQL